MHAREALEPRGRFAGEWSGVKARPQEAGGSMSLLDGLLGGAVGAEMVTVVNSFIQQHGGVQGIVAQFEKEGLSGTVHSWVGTGPNQPVSTDQLHQVFGGGMIAQLAAKAGMNPQELAQ